MVAELSISAGADIAEHAVAAGERGREPVAHLEGLGLERGHESGELVLAVAQPRLMGGGLGVAAHEARLRDSQNEFARLMTALEAEAVSYTHLRAHETDSYLVC